MPIITLSRGSYSRGKDIAEKLAEKLKYTCISREVLLETSDEFNIPEIKLIRALHDAPSVLERFQHGKERYLSYYRYALLNHVRLDNIVYHGLAGHFLLRDIPHVLKVRITANIEDRVLEEMQREDISMEKALYTLKKDDEERRKWGLHIHGTDTWDSRLYDMVLHIGTLTVADAVELISIAVQKPQFLATPESRQILEDLTAAARLQAKLVDLDHRVEVVVQGGVAYLQSPGNVLITDAPLRDQVERVALDCDGIEAIAFQEPLRAKPSYINPYHNI